MIKMFVLVCSLNVPCDYEHARVVIPLKIEQVVCAGPSILSWEQRNMLQIQENETWRVICEDSSRIRKKL